LAGDAPTIAHATVGRQRLGGGIADAWPLAAAALIGLDESLSRMPRYRDHAIALAAAINAGTTARALPDPPQSPLFHVHLPAGPAAVERAHAEMIAEHGVQMFLRVRTSPSAEAASFEISVGEPALDFTPDEVAGLVRELVHRATRA